MPTFITGVPHLKTSHDHCGSPGAWKPPALWTHTPWWMRSLEFLTVTPSPSRRRSVSLSSAPTVRGRVGIWSSGKWRSASCQDYLWMALDLNVSLVIQWLSNRLHQELPMSCSYDSTSLSPRVCSVCLCLYESCFILYSVMLSVHSVFHSKSVLSYHLLSCA